MPNLRVLISGSMAYDFILFHKGLFADQFVNQSIRTVQMSLSLKSIHREYGGSAGSIGYAMRLLGGEVSLISAVGSDASDYLIRCDRMGIDHSLIRIISGTSTARAFIINDAKNNQITAFHSGAMDCTDLSPNVDQCNFAMASVSAATKPIMLAHAKIFAAKGIPFIFDPGQTITTFSGSELRDIIDLAHSLIVNEYEAQHLMNRTGLSEECIARLVAGFVITLGSKGSQVYTPHTFDNIAVIPVPESPDATGCGDAYRGGLLYGLCRQWSWKKACQLASIMGSFATRYVGAQNYVCTKQQVEKLYADHFQESIILQ